MSDLPDNVASRLPEPGTSLSVSPWPYRAHGQATKGFWAVREIPGVGVVLTFTETGKPAGWQLTASTPKEPHLDPSPKVGEEILDSFPELRGKRWKTRREALIALERLLCTQGKSALTEVL